MNTGLRAGRSCVVVSKNLACCKRKAHRIEHRHLDLLGDLKKPAKRAAYLAMAGAC